MIRSLFFASLRSFVKNKYYTMVNLVGLSIGLSCFILITQYVQFEKSFDTFHTNQDLLYRVTSQKIQNGEIQNARAQAPVVLKDALLDNVPEVESAFRIHPLDAKKVTLRRDLLNGERIDVIENKVYHAESAFFDLLDFQLLQEKRGGLLDEPYTVVLSESVAKKMFGEENPMGKSIRIIEDFDQVYKITGVMQDLPENTHFKFNLLISFESFRAQHPNWRWTAWDWDYFFTYIKVRPGIDPKELLTKIQLVGDKVGKPQFDDRNYTMRFDLQPISDIHLASHLEGEFEINSEGRYLNFLYGIALAIIVLAWINFMNLSVARTMSRASEVGIRSTFGASKYHLSLQFFVEAGILHFLSVAFALLLIPMASTFLGELLSIQLPENYLMDSNFWGLLGILWLASIAVTSIYPLAILMGFKPKKVLKGKVQQSTRGTRLWRGLVILQYSVSILLIVLTLVVKDQIEFLEQRDLGISAEQVLTVHAPSIKEETYWNNVDWMRNELKRSAEVTHVTAHTYVPGETLRHVELFQLQGKDASEAVIMKYLPVDYEYFDLFGIELLTGRDFTFGQSTRMSGYVGEVILNEAAVKALGLSSPEDAVERVIMLQHSFGPVSTTKVRGVVKDFEQLALSSSNFPMAFMLARDSHWWDGSEYLSFKLGTENIQESIEKVKVAYQRAFPQESFQYFFADDSYNQAYHSHLKFGKIVTSFSIVSILLAVFGLIGVSTHTVSKKLREIAIRKVHGASVFQIIQKLLGGILALIAIGFIVAAPFSYFLSVKWLENFQVRVPIQAWIFLLPLFSMLLISLVAVLHQALKAAFVNPITIIRDE